jgi:hypothetical protein
VFEDQALADKAVVAVEKTIHYEDGNTIEEKGGGHVEHVAEVPDKTVG